MFLLHVEKWYEVIDCLVELGVLYLILMGGEVILYLDLFQVISYVDKKGMVVGLNINGCYIVYKFYMIELGEVGLNYVQIMFGLS